MTDPHGTDDLGSWRDLPAATISDAMGRLGAMDAGISRISGSELIGRAYPVSTAAGDNATIHRAVNAAPRGAVLVIDAEAHLGRAVWGHVLTLAARRRSLAGAVIDGAVRDVEQIRRLGFPVFARGVCPAGPHKGFKGRHGSSAHCGGVIVHPGDVVIGDSDGVVVVPSSDEEAILARAGERIAEEARWMSLIETGRSSLEVLGLDPDAPRS